LLAWGVGLVVLGLFALGSVAVTSLASIVVIGLFVLIAGVVQIAGAFTAGRRGGFGLHLLVGILSVVVGVLLLRAPAVGLAALTLVLAAWLLVIGIGEIIYASIERFEQWGWALASGIVSAILGLILLAQWPVSSLWFVGLYVGINLLAHGGMWIAVAFMARGARPRAPVRMPAQPAATA
jgi:uncharacterized membrane protein HdeD (DUF308 family)